MIAWPSRQRTTPTPWPARTHEFTSVSEMPASRLPIIGHPLGRSALESILRAALSDAGAGSRSSAGSAGRTSSRTPSTRFAPTTDSPER